jgi:hypothetical protein
MRHALLGTPVVLLTLISCGSGAPPRQLRTPRVEIAAQAPVKRTFYEDGALNLVKAIVPHGDELLVVGNARVCRLSRSGHLLGCQTGEAELSDVEVVTDSAGAPAAIVGSGLWGRPSAAVMGLDGRVRWRYDAEYQAMGTPATVDRDGKRVVLVQHGEKGLQAFDFETGRAVSAGEPPGHIVASEDFDGDGRREVLAAPVGGLLWITDGNGGEVASLRIDEPFRASITSSRPLSVVVSLDERIAVYDGKLNLWKTYSAAGAQPPLRVAASAFLGSDPDAPFVAVFKGRGGWHKSIVYVFDAEGKQIYKEILDGDFQSVAPYGQGGFLLGGRGKVLLYSFAA